jgi:hypothetical protein
MEKLLNSIIDAYWECGYRVKEIILPQEFLDKLAGECGSGRIDMLFLDHMTVKLFPSASKHLQVIIEPV